jgi:y4mF family transcriptional regulator
MAANIPVRESSVAAFVRARRKSNGLTQRKLAELAGVGLFIVDLEADKPSLRMDSVNSVLAVFGKTLGVTDAPRNQE